MSGECPNCNNHTLECICSFISKDFQEIISKLPKEELKNLPINQNKKMEWISVKNQLPNHDEHVLVYDDGEGRCVGYFTKFGWWSYPVGYECSDNSLLDVTHWMPLPEPPNQA